MSIYLKSVKMPYYFEGIIFAWIDLKELIDSQADMNYQGCGIKKKRVFV